jgi:uncharacterized protein (TIGR00730 family)
MMRRVCVFCGSKTGNRPIYTDTARRLATSIARRGLGLIYGAGHIGLMGVLADAALEAGGEVVGVIPQALVDKELAHTGLTEMHIVRSMHERKARMADLSDAFIALPGAYGTADEMFEILTWAQLGLHAKPVGLLNVEGFFNSLLTWLDQAVREGFLRASHRNMLIVGEEAEELLDRLMVAKAAEVEPKWIEDKDR